MTTHDDVELRLRAWMEGAAPSREPASLVDRVASGTARTRQRPAVLVRTGLREGPYALPVLSPMARLLLLAMALLAATVAAVAIGSRALLVSSVDPGPRLVYMLDGDIYVAEEDGTDPVRIVDGDADAECGGLLGNRGLVSPDGTHIAVRSVWDDTCPGTVSILDLDGHLVASVPGAGWDIAWAPDNTRFATWISFGTSIGVYGVDGTLEAMLDASVACCGDHDPRWSLDGTALLVPAHLDATGRVLAAGDPMDDTTRPAVLRLPLDGGPPQAVPAEDPGSRRSVSYSPDGSHAAYTVLGPWPWDPPAGSAAEPARAQLVIIATHGTERAVVFELEPGEQVDAGWATPPLWSPRGDRIAVVVSRYSADANGEQVRDSAHLRVVDPMRGLAITVASVEDGGSLQPIAFSADGDRILVHEYAADGVAGLSSVNADGSGATSLVEGADHGEWLSPPADGDGQTPP